MHALPNLLSLFRLTLSIPVCLAIREGDTPAALAVLALCLVTDGLDGYAARRLGAITDLGRILDPVADKVIAASVALSLHIWHDLPGWFLIAIVARDAAILFGGEWMRRHTGLVPSANLMGKITINVLMITLLIWMIPVPTMTGYSLKIATGFLVLSFAMYLRVWAVTLRGKSLDRATYPCNTETPR